MDAQKSAGTNRFLAISLTFIVGGIVLFWPSLNGLSRQDAIAEPVAVTADIRPNVEGTAALDDVSSTPSPDKEGTDSMGLTTGLLSFLTRLSLTALVGVLTYFFLQQFRAAVNDVKYFENELSTVQALRAAFYLAEHLGDAALKKDVGRRLVHFERTKILEKGQRTVDADNLRTQAEELAAILKLLQPQGKS